MLKVTIKGAKKMAQALKAEHRRHGKALDTAIRVEGFRLMKQMKLEILKGAPGGKRFKALSYIASMRRGKFKKGIRARSRPLQRLRFGVRYHVEDRDPLTVAVGFAGPKVSKRWKWLAQVLQEGFTKRVTGKQRRYFAARGKEMRGIYRGVDARRYSKARYFFLRKSTKRMVTPARPIIDPFWKAHSREAVENIKRNYKLKLAGKRI